MPADDPQPAGGPRHDAASRRPWPAPHLADLDASAADRVTMTISCRDADDLPRVAGAGEVVERDGRPVQVMHNGVVVEEGCYYGPWMTEIIRGLGGVHEPQEEVVFAAVLQRVAESEPDSTLVELGSFWAYYSLWFLERLPDARVVAMEPDPAYLETGRRNFALNGRQGTFVHGAVGPEPGQHLEFVAESSGHPVQVVQHDLASLLADTAVDRVAILMVDIQGFETLLLDRARPLLEAGRVRFLVVSTHHHSISGDALTHQRVRSMLVEMGAHVIAEHSVGESFSGDGLVAVSFDPRDVDLVVPISHARAVDSLFGEPELALNHALLEAEQLRGVNARIRSRLRRQRRARDEVVRELEAVRSAGSPRWTRLPRRAASGLRRRVGGRRRG